MNTFLKVSHIFLKSNLHVSLSDAFIDSQTSTNRIRMSHLPPTKVNNRIRVKNIKSKRPKGFNELELDSWPCVIKPNHVVVT